MTQCEGFIFFEFLMVDSKCGQNGRRDPSLLGVKSCKTTLGSMMKYALVTLKMIFRKKS
jgi:hypothetical protein